MQEENKEKALNMCLTALEDKTVNIVELYQDILSPALNHIIDEYPNDEDLIWREHVRSAIVRNIVEAAFPNTGII